MARIRSIKPEFWTSEQVMECQPLARLLFIGLWNFCDDAGNHPDAEKTLKALVFPGDDIDSATVRRLLDELSENGLLSFYEHEGKRYLHVSGWKHQKIEKPTVKYPPFPGIQQPDNERTGPARQVVDEQSSNGRRALDPGEDRERKGKGKEKIKSNTPPKGDATTVSAEQMVESVNGLSLEVARDYLEHRKTKRAKLTGRAWAGIAKTVVEAIRLGARPDDVLSKAIERGWTGLELDWLQNAGVLHTGGAPPSGRPGSLLTNLPTHTPEMYEDNPDGRF